MDPHQGNYDADSEHELPHRSEAETSSNRFMDRLRRWIRIIGLAGLAAQIIYYIRQIAMAHGKIFIAINGDVGHEMC